MCHKRFSVCQPQKQNLIYSDRNRVPDGKPVAEANRPYLCAKDLGKEGD